MYSSAQDAVKYPLSYASPYGLSSPMSDITSVSTATTRASQYSQPDYSTLLDDLSIIDDVYETYDHEQLGSMIDYQVNHTTKNGAFKHQMVQHLIQTEIQFIHDLRGLDRHYSSKLQAYNASVKAKQMLKDIDGDILFKPTQSLVAAHEALLEALQQRLLIWGPTQLLSDIFNRFYEHTEACYTIYMKGFSATIVTLDKLHKSSAFTKFLTYCNEADGANAQGIGHYLRLPLTRWPAYTDLILQCAQLTEATHPDYNALVNVANRFKARHKQWDNLAEDCLSHYQVYHFYHLVQNSPAQVTPTRRLLLHDEITLIDPLWPNDSSDTRLYLLYNDLFTCCRRQKDGRLVHKAVVILQGARIRPLENVIIDKILEKQQQQQNKSGRKLSLFNSSSRKSVASGHSSGSSSVGTEDHGIYGLELHFKFFMNDVFAYQNPITGMSAGTTTSSYDEQRRLVFRMKSLEQQQIWTDHLTRAIKRAKR